MPGPRTVTLEPIDLPEKGVVLAVCPGILDGYGKRVLYVGASVQRAYMLPDLICWGWGVTVIEPWPENAEFTRKAYGVPVIDGDVATSALGGPYDLGLWWHGPEHVHKEYLPQALANLEASCAFVVLGCPEGSAPQGACLDNVFERHLWEVSTDDLRKFGYETVAAPRPGHPPNITAWKRIR